MEVGKGELLRKLVETVIEQELIKIKFESNKIDILNAS